MNIFELNTIATPLAGAWGAYTATKGQATGIIMAYTVAGLVAGIAIYFAFIGIMMLAEKAAGRSKNGTPNMDRAGTVLSMLLLPLIVLPIMTAWGVQHVVQAIMK